MITRLKAPAVCLALLLLGSRPALAEQNASSPPPPTAAVHPLRQILLAESVEAAQQLAPAPDAGFVVVSPKLPFLPVEELTNRMISGKDRPIDERLLAGIVLVIENYARENDHLVATAIIPPQSIAGGIVRVAVLPGKIRDVKVEGAHWFSESLLREKLKIERGETLRGSEIEQAVNWANTNPYRKVRVQHIERVPDTGEADLTISIEEERPFKFVASYDNTGSVTLGEDRYVAGLNFGNVWGRDHQLSYQFITSNNIDAFRAHAADYRIPLPWRHVLTFNASYVQVNSSLLGGDFMQKGESIIADSKYVIPFRKQRWRGEISATVSFKETNNNLEFGGRPEFSETLNVLTGTVGIGAVRDDSRGNWIASVNLVGSPGEFNSRSTRQRFNSSRVGANPRFVYGQAFIYRNTLLAPGLLSSLRAMVQLSSTNLVPTEQLSLGGMATIRGYEERILSGDSGYTFTHELQKSLPSISLHKKLPKLDTTAVFFWDYGRMLIKYPLITERPSDYLASVGIGARFSIGDYFSAAVDFAHQLEKVEIPGTPTERLHVRMSLSF